MKISDGHGLDVLVSKSIYEVCRKFMLMYTF